MSDSKNLSSETNGKLYLSFHLVGDSTYKQEKKMLEAKLEALCDSAPLIVDHEDASGPHDREIVYCVPGPNPADSEASEAYFRAVRDLFEQTQRYLPSFTQGTEALT